MHYKNYMAVLATTLTLAISFVFTGCNARSDQDSTSSSSDSSSSTIDTADQFTERDLENDYDESEANTIVLSDDGSTTDASGVSIDGSTITISQEGIYVLSGSLRDGQIVVDASDDAKIQIVLSDASISTSSASAIYVANAKKVFLTADADTDNTLSATGADETVDDSNVDGTIFAKDDLTINGTGSLNISSAQGNGVVAKDDLVLSGLTMTVTGGNHAIDANNSVRVADGTYTLTSTEDAIHAEDSDQEVGYIYIADGTFTISAGDDGMHAYDQLQIDGGTITISQSYEGIEGQAITINGGTIDVTASDDGFNAAGGADSSGAAGMGSPDAFSSSSDACLTINGGSIYVNSSGDGLDSNGDLIITGGETYVSGPTDNGNTAVDYGDGASATISGGILIASGSSGMAESFSDDSTQGCMLVTLSSYSTETITLSDSEGNVLATYTPTSQYNCVIISTPEVDDSSTYTLTAGGSDTSITMDGYIYSNASSGMGMGSGGMNNKGKMSNGAMGNGAMDNNSSSDNTTTTQ